MAAIVPNRLLYIDGEWREPVKKNRIPIINPSTEEIIGDIPAATAEDVNIAVEAARRALARNGGNDWASATGAHRAKYLRAIAAKVTERKSELARLEAIDCGKPLDEAAGDIDDVAECFEYHADLAEALDKRLKTPISLPMDTMKCHVLREPIGVVGLITPWNYPMLMATWKVAPSLAAGCAAILKPSELASVTCLELGDICTEVGLPPGILNILTGLGLEAGAPLASHPHVDKVAFTGSSATGSKIMSAAAQVLKPVTLELGGKSPIVVFEDVDLDKAAEWTLFGCFYTNGQICSATSRLLVHESIAAKFLEKLVNWCQTIKISDPLEEGCRLGPVVSGGQVRGRVISQMGFKSGDSIDKIFAYVPSGVIHACIRNSLGNQFQYEKIMNFVSTARTEGATILYGGERPQHLGKKGFFLKPTIISDVNTSMQIWREEVFGPVLCVKTFSTEEEAIELANDTHYGLGAAVLSKDLDRCERMTKAFQSGVVWVNCSQPSPCQAPWGGKKRSGFGRELGEWGIENYLNIKQVTQYVSDEAWGWYTSPS